MSTNQKIILSAVLLLGLSSFDGVLYAQLENRPPVRETPAMTADDVSKLKKHLAGTRDRQNFRAKAKEAVPAPKAGKL